VRTRLGRPRRGGRGGGRPAGRRGTGRGGGRRRVGRVGAGRGGRRPELLLQAGGESCQRLLRQRSVGPELLHGLRAHQLVRHDGGDLRSRPVRETRGGRSSNRDGSDGAGGRKHGETLTHAPSIDRGHAERYPLPVALTHIPPEPDETERRAILAALAAEEAEQPAVSEWAAALLPAREDDEPEP